MKNQKSQQTALANAKEKVDFRIHLINYLVINALLVVINVMLSPGYIWFIWPLLGWGIGITLHALNVFNSRDTNTKERLINKELRKQ